MFLVLNKFKLSMWGEILKRKYWGILILVIVMSFIARTAWNMSMQYNGVCIELGRPLTNDEKIHAFIAEMNKVRFRPVLETVNEYKGEKVPPYTGYVPRERIPFASVGQFLKDNPNCCSVEVRGIDGDDSHAGGFAFSKALGAYAGHIKVNYTLHYLDGHNNAQKMKDALEGTIQNCGQVN